MRWVGAAFDFFVHDDAVKAFAGGIGKEFFGEGDVLLAGEAEAEKDAAGLGFAFFDAFADLDFLLAGEQGDFAHLAQIHLDGVVENIKAAGRLLFFVRGFRLGLFDAFEVGGFDDFDFETAEFGINGVENLRGDDFVGKGVVDVVVGQVTLILGETEQFLDFGGDDRGVNGQRLGAGDWGDLGNDGGDDLGDFNSFGDFGRLDGFLRMTVGGLRVSVGAVALLAFRFGTKREADNFGGFLFPRGRLGSRARTRGVMDTLS